MLRAWGELKWSLAHPQPVLQSDGTIAELWQAVTSALKLHYMWLFVLKRQRVNAQKAVNYPLLRAVTLSHNLKSLLSVRVRGGDLCVSFSPSSSLCSSFHPPPVISEADEAEPNVYDRWDGRGKWCHPSPICICALVFFYYYRLFFFLTVLSTSLLNT